MPRETDDGPQNETVQPKDATRPDGKQVVVATPPGQAVYAVERAAAVREDGTADMSTPVVPTDEPPTGGHPIQPHDPRGRQGGVIDPRVRHTEPEGDTRRRRKRGPRDSQPQ